MAELSPSTRLRRSPYHAATLAAGVSSFTVYNRMLLPSGYGDPDTEYARLTTGVTQWDVAAERQVELAGPDAARLAQILSPRDLSEIEIGQGRYVPLCDHAGTLINDPIVLKVDEDRFWISIADSDVLFWARAIAAERRLDVTLSEPDVSPLAVQGPKAEDVVASLLGERVRRIRRFRFEDAELEGIPLKVARSGWSKQGGFELYLLDARHGEKLWNLVREAGAPWDIGPGYPNACERIEGGLLSWGGDTDDDTNPFEVRLERFVDLDLESEDAVVGLEALRAIDARGPRRHQLGVALESAELDEPIGAWREIRVDGRLAGHMTCGIRSRALGRDIGYALVEREHVPGAAVTVRAESGEIGGELVELPFV